jgi:hypothetical protein
MRKPGERAHQVAHGPRLLVVSPELIRPAGSTASGLMAVSWIRARLSALIAVNNGPSVGWMRNACTSFSAETVTTMQ